MIRRNKITYMLHIGACTCCVPQLMPLGGLDAKWQMPQTWRSEVRGGVSRQPSMEKDIEHPPWSGCSCRGGACASQCAAVAKLPR